MNCFEIEVHNVLSYQEYKLRKEVELYKSIFKRLLPLHRKLGRVILDRGNGSNSYSLLATLGSNYTNINAA